MKCPETGGPLEVEDFANDREHSSCSLYIRRVRCACPVGTLCETIKKAGGPFFCTCTSPTQSRRSPAAATDAIPKIHTTFVEDGTQFPPFRPQVSSHRARAPFQTPSYSSVPERLHVNFEQSLTLAQALDARFGRETGPVGIDALLASDEIQAAYSTEEAQRDVVVAYLRRAVLGGRGGVTSGRNGGSRGRPGERAYDGRGMYRDESSRMRGPPMREERMRRGSFDRPSRSPPRHHGDGRSPSRGPPRVPDRDLPVDPRQVSTSSRDLDNVHTGHKSRAEL
ncbi:hypothetical protein PsorP6_009788 [Peronosclerospora sorghi]|uniref:Uncharacterized protein n=1 Tax=Peronosclerospora sorghi TaxID=230839 RepID=A0ACC0VY49_9STRA|nr:hypothetical protein PsorP6_009788 [Peronosclerospora sorghi]